MKFSCGLWDAIFGEMVEIELRLPDGRPVKRKVTKKWLDRMEEQGKAQRIERDPSQVRVHMLHVLHGYSVQVWTVGTDVDTETVEQFQDETGDLYALTVFEDGKPKITVVKKEIWEIGREEGLSKPAV